MEYDIAAYGANRSSKQENLENPEEECAAGGKEDDSLDFCESAFSREFARRAKREQEEEERMIKCLKKTNDILDEIANACEKAIQSLGRVEGTITSFVPRVERMFCGSAAAAAAGCGGGKIPPAGQEGSLKNFCYEKIEETDIIGNEVRGGEREGAFNERDPSAAELNRTVRESAPSPEPRRGYFNQRFDLSKIILSSGLYER